MSWLSDLFKEQTKSKILAVAEDDTVIGEFDTKEEAVKAIDDYNSKKNEMKEDKRKEEILKNVSEPILSFVQCVKDNPKRFRIFQKYVCEEYSYEKASDFKIFVIDKLHKKTYTTQLYYYYGWRNNKNCHMENCSLSWVNESELKYIYEELEPLFSSINNARKEKVEAWKRKKYMEIYCK